MEASKEKASEKLSQKESIDDTQKIPETRILQRSENKSKAREKEIVVAEKYILGKRLGKGSFGQIFLGVNKENNQYYAIKFESIHSKSLQLGYEYRVLKLFEDKIGFPQTYWYGTEGNYNILVMDLLGPNLHDLMDFNEKPFSLKTTILLADQMISRIEVIHSKNYIHRDMKPENFLTGEGKKSNIIYIIDFGLSKKYRDSKTHQHIVYKENKSLVGTARYASINTHLGIEQSRRDDLEALGYMLIFLIKGRLPWMGERAVNKQEKYLKILDKKMKIAPEILTKGLPSEFASYIHYCKALNFEDRPDYTHLKNLFRMIMVKNNILYDFNFDWTLQDTTITEHKFLENVQDKPKVLIDTDRQSDKDEENENINSSSNNQDQNDKNEIPQDQEIKSEESDKSDKSDNNKSNPSNINEKDSGINDDKVINTQSNLEKKGKKSTKTIEGKEITEIENPPKKLRLIDKYKEIGQKAKEGNKKFVSKKKKILKNKSDKPSKSKNSMREKSIKKKDQDGNNLNMKKINPSKEVKKDCMIF